MKRMKRLTLLLLICILAAPSSQAAAGTPSAGKIINRCQKASGGNAFKRVKSVVMSGSLKTAEISDGRFTLRSQSPDRLRIDVDAGSRKQSECYNGKSAWRVDSRGLRTLLGVEAKRLRLEALLFSGRLQDLSRNRVLPGQPQKTTVEGRDAYAIEFVKDDARLKLFFDASSGLLVKQESQTADGLQEVFYWNHRPVEGVMEPFSIKIKDGAGEALVTIDRVEHNRAPEEAAFRYPQVEGSRPLPELEPLMKSIVANQEKIEELREHYTCLVTETERKLDGSGRIKESVTKVYEVTPVGEEFVERLMSVDGKELWASERDKEDRRVQKEVEDIIKRREKKQEKKDRAAARGEKPEEDKDNITILDFLRLSEVTSVRREVFGGHEVIAFDFEPRKGIKPRNRAETIVSKLAGTMWVDEDAQQIARVEARLTDSFKMGGGLVASISPSTAMVFEQEKVGGEIWLPSFAEANISARVLLFAKFNRSFVRRYSDYKKYQIDSAYELTGPKQKPKPDNER
ncbi:MAG TPA: hypothetical protein VJH03_14600 [Blastocatellia bacterium]|nr:hypothetical protein [Blastocatellia bacterium]